MKNQIILMLALLLVGCKKEGVVTYNTEATACGVKNPIQNLPWLNEIFRDSPKDPKESGIVLYQYKDSQIINIFSSLSSSTHGSPFYCDGTFANFKTKLELEDYLTNRKKIAVLFGEKFQAN